MPDFNPSRLTGAELAAYGALLESDGPAEMTNLFSSIVRKVATLRDEGHRPENFVAIIIGDYFDLEPLTMRGPIVRYRTIVLVKVMVEQALELANVGEEE
jgi:hypothetical protein